MNTDRCGLEKCSCYSNSLLAGRSGIRSLVRVRLSAPSRMALGPTQPPTQWVPSLARSYNSRGMALATQPYVAPRLKKELSYTSTALCALWHVIG
jgi:hypothetical protein